MSVKAMALIALAGMFDKLGERDLLLKVQRIDKFVSEAAVYQEFLIIPFGVTKTSPPIDPQVRYYRAYRSWFPWLHQHRIGSTVLQEVPTRNVCLMGTPLRSPRIMVQPSTKERY